MSTSLLLIDAGNSRVKWATADDSGSLAPKGELPTGEVTAESIGKLAKEFPGYRAVLSSVVPKLVPYFQDSFQGRFHRVNSDSPALGLLFKYPEPSQIGADRLAAAAAVREDSLGPAIIIQCGTATAFSVLDNDGYFCGGVIAPGPHAQLAALVGGTAQLPALPLWLTHQDPRTSSEEAIRQLSMYVTPDLEYPRTGTSTEEAIRLGVMLGYRGGVNEILRHLCRHSKPPLTSIILTGGNAHFLTGPLEFRFTLRPLLVFEGLRIIGLRAFKETET